jgi:hypothetical protein
MDGPMTDENEVIAKEQANLIELLLEQDEVYWAPTFSSELVAVW